SSPDSRWQRLRGVKFATTPTHSFCRVGEIDFRTVTSLRPPLFFIDLDAAALKHPGESNKEQKGDDKDRHHKDDYWIPARRQMRKQIAYVQRRASEEKKQMSQKKHSASQREFCQRRIRRRLARWIHYCGLIRRGCACRGRRSRRGAPQDGLGDRRP